MEAFFWAGKPFLLLLTICKGHQKTFDIDVLVRKLDIYACFPTQNASIVLIYLFILHRLDQMSKRPSCGRFSAAPAKKGT